MYIHYTEMHQYQVLVSMLDHQEYLRLIWEQTSIKSSFDSFCIERGSRWPGISSSSRNNISLANVISTSSPMPQPSSLIAESFCHFLCRIVKLIQFFYHLIHAGPELGLRGQTSKCKVGCLVGYVQRVLALKTAV